MAEKETPKATDALHQIGVVMAMLEHHGLFQIISAHDKNMLQHNLEQIGVAAVNDFRRNVTRLAEQMKQEITS